MKQFENLKKVKERNGSIFYTVSYKKRMRVFQHLMIVIETHIDHMNRFIVSTNFCDFSGTKVLIVTGKPAIDGVKSEILDMGSLENPEVQMCKDFPNFPKEIKGSTGVRLGRHPVICGGLYWEHRLDNFEDLISRFHIQLKLLFCIAKYLVKGIQIIGIKGKTSGIRDNNFVVVLESSHFPGALFKETEELTLQTDPDSQKSLGNCFKETFLQI